MTRIIITILNNITISFIQGIYTYIPETNHVPKQYNVAAILSLLFMVPISLASALALMYLLYQHFLMYVCIFLIYLLACSITLVISNTTCYLHLVFTIIVSSLLFVYFVCMYICMYVCMYSSIIIIIIIIITTL
jgi:hypothetical protein